MLNSEKKNGEFSNTLNAEIVANAKIKTSR
jgi:hypothetical protein